MSAELLAELQKDARRRLKYKQDELAAAVADALAAETADAYQRAQVNVRRKERGIATYTAKVLCPHTFITHKRLRVMGYDKHAYSCNGCKTHILSRVEL